MTALCHTPSRATMTDCFAPPPFQAEAACQRLCRDLRDGRQLTERQAGQFEWRGLTVLHVEVQDHAIVVRLARQPARSPQWDEHTLHHSADVRRFTDELKRRCRRWEDRDE